MDTPTLESITVTLDTGLALEEAGWDRPTVFSWYANQEPPDSLASREDYIYFSPGTQHPPSSDHVVAPAPTLSELLEATPGAGVSQAMGPTERPFYAQRHDAGPFMNDNPSEAAAALWLAVHKDAPAVSTPDAR